MRKTLAVLCLMVAAATGCASSESPTPQATPTAEGSQRPPMGYVLTGPR